jgi:hypothetical protein
MTNRAWLPIVLACFLGGCGGIVPLNGDDAGNGEHGETPDSGSLTSDVAQNDDDADIYGNESSETGPTVTLNPTVYRFYPNGTTPYNFRAANEDPNTIDLQDCDDSVALQFNLTIGGLPTADTIEVWAGTTDCSQPSARQSGDGPHCWQVVPQGSFANVTQEYGLIYARNITRFIGVSNPTDELDAVTGVPGPSACDALGPVTSSCSVPVVLYFMYFPARAPTGAVPESSAVYLQPVSVRPNDGGSCPSYVGT